MGQGGVMNAPWDEAISRGEWAEADRIHAQVFASIRVQHQINYYEDLAWISKSWLVKKVLRVLAWARGES